MAGNGVYVVAVLSLVAVSSARGTSANCAWNEYYDSSMDDCGPCHEICVGVVHPTRVKLGTENQCRNECSDYLVSVTCTEAQYFDHNVHSCAPCSEICDHHKYTTTTGDCFSKCQAYLPTMAKRCTEKQYFDDSSEALTCKDCVDLCSPNRQNGTNEECFLKCHHFVEENKRPVLNRGDEDDGLGLSSKDTVSTSTLRLHPGVITSITIGVVIMVVVALAASYYWCRLRPKRYAPAPKEDEETALEEPTATTNAGEQVQDQSFGMKELGPSIQVSSEGINATAQQTTVEVIDMDQQYARPETDPLAPSSAVCQQVFYRQNS